MPAAYQLRNPDTGKVLIDTNYVRIGLVKAGEMTWNSGQEMYQFSVTAVDPIVFVEGGASFGHLERSGNNWTYYYRGWPNAWSYSQQWAPPIPGSPVLQTPRFYVFDMMRPNTSGRGLWIRDPNTLVTIFSSDMPPMNIRWAGVSPPIPGGNTGTYQSPGGGWQRMQFIDGGWDTAAGVAQQVAIPVANLGLPPGRRWAWFSPWRRGANFSGFSDDFTVIEANATANGYLGWGWVLDVWTQWGEPGFGQGAWGAHVNRPQISLIDVTDLPYPFDY